MAGGNSVNNRVIFAKKEVTYKTDPTPVGTDAMLVSNPTWIPYQGNVVSRSNVRSYYGASKQINTSPHVQIDFDIEIAGAGAAATEPAYGRLLEACGYTATVASPIVQWAYTPNSTAPASQDSVTLYIEVAGETQVVVGCRGNVSFNFSTGGIPVMSFTFLGIYARPAASTITPDFTAFQDPVPVTDANTSTFDFDSYSVLAETLTINTGNQLAYRNVVNSESVIISGREMTGSMSIEHELIATKNFWPLIESHAAQTTAVLDLVHNTGAGSIIEVDAPSVQVSGFTPGESDGILMSNFDLSFIPSSGNDELTFITK